jgi:hypothetical protein
MKQLQSHIYLTAGLLLYGEKFNAFPHILGIPSTYMTLQLLHSEFPYIYEEIFFSFLSVHAQYLWSVQNISDDDNQTIQIGDTDTESWNCENYDTSIIYRGKHKT